MSPADIKALVEQLTPVQARFRAASSPLQTFLPRVTFTALGQSLPVQISSVGLGYALVRNHHFVITIANAASVTETFAISPLFPANMIAQNQVQINGGAASYQATGIGTLANYLRQRRVGGLQSSLQANARTGALLGPGLNRALVNISYGSNLSSVTAVTGTTTPPVPVLTGVSTVTVAASASTNNTMTVDYQEIIKLAYDKDSLLGALPLQNNSTFANLTTQIQASLSGTRADLNMPFFSAGADLTFTLTSYYVDTTYKFFSIPNDPSLYQPMVANSYQVMTTTGLQATSTGVGTFTYNWPQNAYMISAHIFGTDSSGIVVPYSWLDPLYLVYNGQTIRPWQAYQLRMRAEQFLDYGWDLGTLPGYRLWDGDATSDDIVATDDCGWLDTYAAASPQLIGDVASTISTTVNYELTREQVVAGSVQVIGG